jgi:anti-sigma factor RsiW
MNHPDLNRLTIWIQGFLETDDAAEVESHVSVCRECGVLSDGLREEARILTSALSSPDRLNALKAGLLQSVGRRRPWRGLLWQVPLAAVALLGLIGVLLSGGGRHDLIAGRVELQDGRIATAPSELTASQAWRFRALDQVRVRLCDRSTVDLDPGTQISLIPEGARGVLPDLASGRAEFRVAPDSRRLIVASPVGRVDTSDGSFSVKIVSVKEGGVPMTKTLAGAIVTVFAGSISLSNAAGSVEAQTGQSAALTRAEAPLLVSAPQDQQDELLRRLEQLAARVAKLEEEVNRLEEKNKQLKLQLTSNGGGGWRIAPGQAGGGPGAAPGSTIIIEKEEPQKRPEQPNNPRT